MIELVTALIQIPLFFCVKIIKKCTSLYVMSPTANLRMANVSKNAKRMLHILPTKLCLQKLCAFFDV